MNCAFQLGAKKAGGLGAQKVNKDFAEIEREAELADLGRVKAAEEQKLAAKTSEEDEAKAVASMRLAYQDLSMEQKKAEEKLKNLDPKKAVQVERLGMGVAKKGGVSHSMITEISTIDQEEPSSSGSRGNFNSNSRRSNLEDDFEFIGNSEPTARDEWRTSNNNKFEFGSSGSGGGSNWEKEFEVLKSAPKSTKNDSANNWATSFDDPPSR